jgi:hypothetical protein
VPQWQILPVTEPIMKKKSLVGAALALLALMAGNASAQNDPNDPARETGATRGASMTNDASWDALDVNKDGYLTKNELMGTPALAQKFARIDTDGDGKISPEEWKAEGKRTK